MSAFFFTASSRLRLDRRLRRRSGGRSGIGIRNRTPPARLPTNRSSPVHPHWSEGVRVAYLVELEATWLNGPINEPSAENRG
jgi:hypothetical protein